MDDITWCQLSKPCWTHAIIRRTVVMLMCAAGLLQMSSQKRNTLENSNKCIHACMNLLHIYHPLPTLPAIHSYDFFLWIGFLKWPSQSLHLISIFVFDMLYIPSRCIQIFSDSTVPTCTPLAMGLLLNFPPKKLCMTYLNGKKNHCHKGEQQQQTRNNNLKLNRMCKDKTVLKQSKPNLTYSCEQHANPSPEGKHIQQRKRMGTNQHTEIT